MQIDCEKVKRILKDCDGEDCLETALKKIQSDNAVLTKEEAVVRLLKDLIANKPDRKWKF